jgi:hypothetical protein
MPAKSPRLNVTVTDLQHALLVELGALQGRSAASFLREMLDAATPMFQAMLPVYRAAAQQEATQPEALQLAIKEALSGVEAQRSQLDLLQLLAETSTNPSNDVAGDAVNPAPSGAREELGGIASKRGKRA